MNNRIFLKNLILYIATIFLISGSISLKAQESLTGLQVNPKIKQLYLNKSKNKATQEKSPVELPFIDDFAKSIGYADSSLWQDEYVFINQTYAYNPLSIGVATLDAIDGTGAIHSNANSFAFGADTLTSKPINLNYPGDNTIFLSFYYQPGGLGDTPDTKDTLLLEFYSIDSVWNKMWHVIFNENDSVLTEKHTYGDTTIKTINGDTLTDLKQSFQQVIIPVNENKYLNNSFQFRFRNYASLSGNDDIESKTSNSDHWNLDFVILDKDRNINDTIIEDVAFSEPIGSLLKTYEALPWTHFSKANAHEMEDSISITYRNLFNDSLNCEREFEIEDIKGATGTYYFSGGTWPNIPPFSYETYKRPIDYIFPYDPSTDSALFEIRSYLVTETPPELSPYRWNDTTRFMQKFYNYYAYDDGSAENGYGIIGEGTERAMVAMRYNTYKKDTLRGVQIFFNQTLNDVNQYTFKIHVWSETDGKPGNIIYTQEGLKPQNEDELNKFTTYVLDSVLILENSFFIGWQKELNTPEMLNVGFDVNRINNEKLYYNFSGNWVRSQFEGTIMIRPMFGHEINVSTGIISPPKNQSLEYTIYPNPASDILNININDQFIENYRYTIFDIHGRVFKDETSQQSPIDISSLNTGVYFIRIANSKGSNTTKKFMIVR